MINLIISGVLGRMGSRILALATQDPDFKIVGALEAKGSPAIEQEILPGLKVTDELEPLLEKGEVLVEFTTPEATLGHLDKVAPAKKAMVIGTTGFSSEQLMRIQRIAKIIPVVLSPNMSIGVNVLFGLAAEAAKRLGPGYDIEIIEAHHRHKKDAPSGTAKKLTEEIANSVGKKAEQIPTHAIRAGDIVGDHTVIYAGVGERIELIHRAQSRDTFAQGALRAAKFVVGQRPGLYNMKDVLG